MQADEYQKQFDAAADRLLASTYRTALELVKQGGTESLEAAIANIEKRIEARG